MYKIAICDDNTQFSTSLEKVLTSRLQERNVGFELTVFQDPSELLAAFENDGTFHLIFLDILYEKHPANGIEIARKIRSFHTNTDFVFLSYSSDYALESYEVSPLHYIIKSPVMEKLEDALNRFFNKHSEQNFYIKTREGILSLPVSDILYFEIYGHNISVYVKSGKSHTFSGTLKKVESQLPPSLFIRAHKSFLVNMEHIVKIARYEITLSNDATVPVSKKKYPAIMNAFAEYSTKNTSM